MSDALICKSQGWDVGTHLAGDEGYGETIIEITAIGETGILAKEISHKGKPRPNPRECSWTLSCRDWREVLR